MKKSLLMILLPALLAGCSFGVKSKAEPAIQSASSSSEKRTFSSTSLQEGECDEISFHFLELGNANAGDCIYIRAGENDILIDAGSKYGSYDAISSALNEYIDDGKLEYVVATHAHQDHIAAFSNSTAKETGKGIFYNYEVGTVIDFGESNSTAAVYKNYVSARESCLTRSGGVHYSAAACVASDSTGTYLDKNPHRVYTLGVGLTMEVLSHRFNEETPKADEENENSVCLLFSQGDSRFLFTGDLEQKGIASLLERNALPHCRLFKAGHHGSRNAVSPELLSAITPEAIVISTAAGVSEYTVDPDNVFPYQSTIDLMAPFTENIFLTTSGFYSGKKGSVGSPSPVNGRVSLFYGVDGKARLECSASTLPLKDSEWFNRIGDCYAAVDPNKPNRVWNADHSLYEASLFQGENQ